MDDIILNLEKLGFSSTEAKVYVTLLKNSRLNGYQVSKILNISKSSGYSALNNLYKKNIIYLIPGESNTYYPEKPNLVFERMLKKIEDSATAVVSQLERENRNNIDLNYYNVYGFNNNLEKAKELILSAKKEICLNTGIDLWEFEKEIRQAAEKGVRILVFAMHRLDVKDLPIEAYFYPNEAIGSVNTKTILSVDYEVAHVFGGYKNKENVGTFSRNENLISLVSQHIVHDIYNVKLMKKTGVAPITDDERIYTIEEKLFFGSVKKK